MGNRVASVTPNLAALGSSIQFRYDRDRLITVDYPSKTDVTLTYGPPGASNFAAGRLIRRQDETGSVSFVYGAMGRDAPDASRLRRTRHAGNR